MLTLHRQLLGLVRTRFLPNLVANSTPPSEAAAAEAHGAGGLTFMSLRLTAFWLSWVRHRTVKDYGAMLLSQGVLDALEAWGGPSASPEEQDLRQKLHEDFSRFGVADNDGPWGIGMQVTAECSKGAKDKGNAAFKAGRSLVAVSQYSMAIDLNPSDASLYCNRAAAMLKWAGSSQMEQGEQRHHLRQVVADCEQAIAITPDYVKAHYRKAQALLASDEPAQACDALEAGLAACPGEETLEKLWGEALPKLPREEAAARVAAHKAAAEERQGEATRKAAAEEARKAAEDAEAARVAAAEAESAIEAEEEDIEEDEEEEEYCDLLDVE